MPQPKQPLLIGPFPVLFLENMGFDGRSEKGDGKGTTWTSPQRPERTPRDETGIAGGEGQEKRHDNG